MVIPLALSDALPPLIFPSPYGHGMQPFQPFAEMSRSGSPPKNTIAIATHDLQLFLGPEVPPDFSSMRPAQSWRKLVNDRRVSLISFTGFAGRQVAPSVGARLGKCVRAWRSMPSLSMKVLIWSWLPGLFLAPSVPLTALYNDPTALRAPTRIEDVTERLVHAYGQVRIGDPLSLIRSWVP